MRRPPLTQRTMMVCSSLTRKLPSWRRRSILKSPRSAWSYSWRCGSETQPCGRSSWRVGCKRSACPRRLNRHRPCLPVRVRLSKLLLQSRPTGPRDNRPSRPACPLPLLVTRGLQPLSPRLSLRLSRCSLRRRLRPWRATDVARAHKSSAPSTRSDATRTTTFAPPVTRDATCSRSVSTIASTHRRRPWSPEPPPPRLLQ